MPDTLSVSEVELILNSVDMSGDHGQRNRAILETLYACGLRVSELINLKVSEFYPEIEYVKVLGKNNKERIIPMAKEAIQQNLIYIEQVLTLNLMGKASMEKSMDTKHK